MHERWREEITARAAAHWTEARTAELTGGKALPITPRDAPMLLRALGLLRTDASMPPAQVRKFLQINHMVKLLEPAMRELRERHLAIRILDAGCGRSYLTLLLAFCAKQQQQRVEVLGVDRNAALIDECRRRAEVAELADVVKYAAAPLDGLDVRATWAAAFGTRPAADVTSVHAVIALHACDTATDDAITLGVHSGADLIAVAPCCQAELARGWAAAAERGDAGAFAPIWRSGHLRRETAAHLTDAMRVLLLGAANYDARSAEFIAAEHSAKNTLVRAVRRATSDIELSTRARAEYTALVAATGGHGIALASRI